MGELSKKSELRKIAKFCEWCKCGIENWQQKSKKIKS